MVGALVLGFITLTGVSVDVKVDGDGYLRFVREGRVVYAKQAKLQAQDGKLVNSNGDAVIPTISISTDVEKIEVDLEGNVFGVRSSTRGRAGRLVLALFDSSSALSPENGVLVSSTRPKIGDPGDGANGVIRTGGTTSAPKTESTPVKTSGNSSGTKPNTSKSVDGVSITLHSEAEVEGANILLGEVADIEASEQITNQLRDVDLGDTPAFGIKRYLDRSRVISRLKAAGFKPETFNIVVPSKVQITRKAQIVPHQQFIDVATSAIQERSSQPLPYQCNDIMPDYSAPIGDLQLKAENIGGLNTQNVSVTVAIYVDGKRLTSRTLRFKADTPAVAVKSGNVVNVIFKTGGVQMQLPGIARSSAGLGGAIQVEVKAGSNDTKTTHTGVVVAPGLIEVKL